MLNPGNIARTLSRFLGSSIIDVETGETLGKAFIVSWRGHVHLIGLTSTVPLRPVAISSPRVAYWKTSMGFTAPREPDFPNIR